MNERDYLEEECDKDMIGDVRIFLSLWIDEFGK